MPTPEATLATHERRLGALERAGYAAAASGLPVPHASTHRQGGSDAVLYQVASTSISATLVAADRVVLVGAGGVAINLPAASTAGQIHEIKDASGVAGASPITVGGNGHTIDGASTYAIDTNYESLRVISDGTNWFII